MSRWPLVGVEFRQREVENCIRNDTSGPLKQREIPLHSRHHFVTRPRRRISSGNSGVVWRVTQTAHAALGAPVIFLLK